MIRRAWKPDSSKMLPGSEIVGCLGKRPHYYAKFVLANKSPRRRDTHIFDHEADSFYVEPSSVVTALLKVESFTGRIHDPCAGTGTIPYAAISAGYEVTCADIVPRIPEAVQQDFLSDVRLYDSIITNPPYDARPTDLVEAFTMQTLKLSRFKVAVFLQTARVHHWHWVHRHRAPLRTLFLVTPRPSVPPYSYLVAGGKPQGGRSEYCWALFEQKYSGPVDVRWLYHKQESP